MNLPGKTYLTTKLRDILAASPHNLAVAVLSIDDLYLPHEGLVEVATSHPQNPLLSGRGQPGTHDVELGTTLLKSLKKINEPGAAPVQFPWFDKSQFNGQGDRAENGVLVRPPLDVVLFEGWCVGFCPISDAEIDRRYEMPIADIAEVFDLKQYQKESIREINVNLWKYVEWWPLFDSLIQVSSSCISIAHHAFSLSKLTRRRLNRLRHTRTRTSTIGASNKNII